MTGKECFDAAMNLLAEQEAGAAHYEQFARGAINQLLANCLREMNALREARGEQAQKLAPTLKTMAQEIEADEAMVRECFPYGLAALLICEEDHERFNWLGAEFAARLDRHCPAAQFSIRELY